MEILLTKLLEAALNNGLSLGILLYLYWQNRKDLDKKDQRIEFLQDKSLERSVAVTSIISANTESSNNEARALEAMDKRLDRIEAYIQTRRTSNEA